MLSLGGRKMDSRPLTSARLCYLERKNQTVYVFVPLPTTCQLFVRVTFVPRYSMTATGHLEGLVAHEAWTLWTSCRVARRLWHPMMLIPGMDFQTVMELDLQENYWSSQEWSTWNRLHLHQGWGSITGLAVALTYLQLLLERSIQSLLNLCHPHHLLLPCRERQVLTPLLFWPESWKRSRLLGLLSVAQSWVGKKMALCLLLKEMRDGRACPLRSTLKILTLYQFENEL